MIHEKAKQKMTVNAVLFVCKPNKRVPKNFCNDGCGNDHKIFILKCRKMFNMHSGEVDKIP